MNTCFVDQQAFDRSFTLFLNPTPLSDTREKHTLLRGLGVLPCHSQKCFPVATYHILKLSLGGIQVKRAHNSAKFLGGDATVTVLVEKSESFLELCNLLFSKLVSLKNKGKSETWNKYGSEMDYISKLLTMDDVLKME